MHREPDPHGETDSRSPADPARPPPAPGRAAHRLTGLRAAAALADLGLAPVAAGVIARRRGMMTLLERVGADDRAVRRMHRLRCEFGSGPVELVLPGRRVLVPLDPADVSRRLRRDLVLFLTTSLLAHLIDELDLELRSHPQPTPAAALPITFDNFRIDFTARARALQAAQSHSPGGR